MVVRAGADDASGAARRLAVLAVGIDDEEPCRREARAEFLKHDSNKVRLPGARGTHDARVPAEEGRELESGRYPGGTGDPADLDVVPVSALPVDDIQSVDVTR
jgi:hypothetical protein